VPEKIGQRKKDNLQGLRLREGIQEGGVLDAETPRADIGIPLSRIGKEKREH